MPDEALSQPIVQWWRAHHEVGHAVYRAIKFEERLEASAARWFRELTQMSGRALAPVDVVGYIEELFAQWFDFVFAFARGDEAYQCAIWTSWIKIRRVWQRKEEYVARSLAIYMYNREEEWLTAAVSREASMDYLLERLEDLSVVLRRGVPEFGEYWGKLSDDAKRMAVRNVDVLLPLISPPLVELERALADSAPAAYAELDEHAQTVLRGEVVLSGVSSPAALLARCRTRLFEDHGGVASVSQDIALAVTRWNHQQTQQADEVRAAELIETSERAQ
jgi:hypothetical protein